LRQALHVGLFVEYVERDGVYATKEHDHAIADVHFAEVAVVLLAHQATASVSHCLDIQVTPFFWLVYKKYSEQLIEICLHWKEVAIDALNAVKSGAFLVFHGSPAVDAYVWRQSAIQDPHIVNLVIDTIFFIYFIKQMKPSNLN
jgi:hypothetical protein